MTWLTRYRSRTSPSLDGLCQPAVRRRLATTTPAVVIPAFNATGLGIVRDLGRLGIPVVAVDHYPASMGLASRYAVPTVCHDPRYDEPGLIEDLERIGAALPQRAVIFPAFDDHVWAIARHADRLEEFYIIPFARWDVMRRLADKEEQLRAAWRAGVDTPRTAFVHAREDLWEAASHVPFPAMLKPLHHQEMRRRFGVKVVLVPTADDLGPAYEKVSVCGSLMLQEIIPGEDRDLYTFGAYHDASSRPLGLFVARKIRQHPPLYGEARVAETVWVDDVAEAGLRLLGELSYHGLSQTEFKRDPRDERLKLMEINARHWLYHPLATVSGVNLSHIAYSDALGRPFEGPRQTDGARWLDSWHDARDSLIELGRGDMRLRPWIASFRHVRVDAVCALDDPGPAAVAVVGGVRRGAHRATARLSPTAGARAGP
jgi:D-aspartate ligase